MTATAGGSPARRTTTKKSGTAKGAAASGRLSLPHPVPPREETLNRAPANGDAPDTEADMVMLPGGFSFAPVRFDNEQTEDIRVPLFYGNDGTEYTVLANPAPGIALEFIHLTRAAGGSELAQTLAMDWLYEQMLGDDGYAALRRVRTADPSKFVKLTAIITRIANGPLEIPKDAASA